MSKKQLPVLKVIQNSYEIYLTKLRADELKDFTMVDRFNPDLPMDDENQGYQRETERRYVKFADYLIQAVRPLCPTALLLSARSTALEFNPKTSTIEIDTDKKLRIVDGQHRAEGYNCVVFEKNVERLAGFEVPIIIVPNIDKITEMKQFEVINRTQKGVRLDLVNAILTQYAERVGEDKLKPKELTDVIVSRTIEILNNTPNNPWFEMVIMPNEKAPTKKEIFESPELANSKIVRATSFMTSIKPIHDHLDYHGLIGGDVKQQATILSEILIEYWGAIKELLPECFENPSNFVIQKTPGLFSLHTICKKLISRIYAEQKGWILPEFKRRLENVEAFMKPAFWNKQDGEAAKYGSMKGFTELATLIDRQLHRTNKAA